MKQFRDALTSIFNRFVNENPKKRQKSPRRFAIGRGADLMNTHVSASKFFFLAQSQTEEGFDRAV